MGPSGTLPAVGGAHPWTEVVPTTGPTQRPTLRGMVATTHVVVMGLMASGKSSVGRTLAAHLHRPFLDNDELLEARYGAQAAAIQAADGQDELHHREALVVLDALAQPDPSVITAAASVVEDAEVRSALLPHDVVWLDAPWQVLARRVAVGDAHRPGRGQGLAELLRQQQLVRAPLFREVADITVDTSAATPGEVATDVLGQLR